MTHGTEPATKADLQSLRQKFDQRMDGLDKKIDSVRTELKGDFKRLALGLDKTNARIGALESTLRTEMQDNTKRILDAIDKFAEKAENYDRKTYSHGDMLTDHESRLKEHDRRLTALESKP